MPAQSILCGSVLEAAPALSCSFSTKCEQPAASCFLPQCYSQAAGKHAAADAQPDASHSSLQIQFISATEDKVICFTKVFLTQDTQQHPSFPELGWKSRYLVQILWELQLSS